MRALIQYPVLRILDTGYYREPPFPAPTLLGLRASNSTLAHRQRCSPLPLTSEPLWNTGWPHILVPSQAPARWRIINISGPYIVLSDLFVYFSASSRVPSNSLKLLGVDVRPSSNPREWPVLKAQAVLLISWITFQCMAISGEKVSALSRLHFPVPITLTHCEF